MELHYFSPSVATECGVTAAILFQNIYYWCSKNAESSKNYYDGTTWTYNTIKELNNAFPYLSERQIRTGLQKLKEAGYVSVGNYNKAGFDRTLWYAVTEKGHKAINGTNTDNIADDANLPKCQMQVTEMSNASDQNVKCNLPKCQMQVTEMSNASDQNVTPIPNNIPNINTDSIPNRESEDPLPKKYGIFNNVILTDEDLKQLQIKFPSNWQERIENLGAFLRKNQQTAYKYSDHFATIIQWAARDKLEEKQEVKQSKADYKANMANALLKLAGRDG